MEEYKWTFLESTCKNFLVGGCAALKKFLVGEERQGSADVKQSSEHAAKWE